MTRAQEASRLPEEGRPFGHLAPPEARTCNVLIVRGVEGLSVYLDDTRVAGNKPWGGGDIVAEWTVPMRDVLRAIGIKEDA